MSTTCSIKIKVDKLPKIFKKVEFFLFRAMEQKGMDFYKISQQPKTAESIEVFKNIRDGKLTKEKLESLIGKKYAQGLINASVVKDFNYIGTDAYRIAQMVYLFDTIKNSLIPSYITEYTENAKGLRNQGKEEGAKEYEKFAANLQNLIAMWDQVGPNFLSSSEIFSVNTKFKMDEEGLVDLNEVADDEKKMLNKMVFDRPANEVDPINDVDKAVELFLRSIHVKDRDDEYGYTVTVDYANFIKSIFDDVQNSLGLSEILEKLEKNKSKVPEYQQVIDKFKYKPNPTSEETQFRINFTNSFSKAFITIMITSIEQSEYTNGIPAFKVLEAASNKSSIYERIIGSNFTSRGMRVSNGKESINLAHQVDGVWMLTMEDIPKIEEFLNQKKLTAEEFKKRRVEFLKGLGFEFSPKTEDFLITSSYLNNKVFDYIYNHLIKSLDPKNDGKSKVVILDPIKIIKQKVKNLSKEEEKKDDIRWSGQNNNIVKLIAEELKNNTAYNLEKSVITAEGTIMYAIQLHNNFTILNKFLSGVDKYKTLDDILNTEPSMFWMDPTKNPSIRSSYYLNSLFYFDPQHPKYGQRRKVKNGEYSDAADATPVILTFKNTGGLQLKLKDDFEKEGASSTALNELDKILQDLHGFFAQSKGHAGVLRLGDKSTDLAIGLNFGLNVETGKPIEHGKPLGKELVDNNIFTSESFKKSIKNALVDYLEMRYLGEKGFFDTDGSSSGLKMGASNFKNFGYFESILKADTKSLLDEYIKTLAESEDGSLDMIRDEIKIKEFNERLDRDILDYFTETTKDFYNKIENIRSKFGIPSKNLVGRDDLKNTISYYIANTFITDLDQMKIFFGDAIFFKAFHKRASKDSATGIFTIMDEELINNLNDESNSQGYGANTNLSAKRLIDRIYQSKLSELETSNKSEEEKETLRKQYKSERDEALSRQIVSKSFKSAVLKDVVFDSEQGVNIIQNIDRLAELGYLSDNMKAFYTASLRDVIEGNNGNKGYKGGIEPDGQGKCTFDFYRIMSIATSAWIPEQEEVYKKIVEYNHYDELAEETNDDTKRMEYIQKRDAVGYDPTEPVYFPPKKFQYDGPLQYSRIIDGQEYNISPPIFDKFSLQPLIPTVIKKAGVKTADWHLARKMEYNGVGYVKFESGSKVESPSNKDEYYSKYDQSNPSVREINKFNPESTFKSEQELFFNHFKEQMTIDAEIHDNAIFGSQIRKLILMNLEKPEFKGMKDNYIKYLGQLAEIEKISLYNEMGIQKVDGKLKVADMKKMVDYFFNEISKKEQDINVKKALNFDETTGKFEIPLDASVQRQVLEGIIISAINNRVVRYKTNGSMLTQMAITGSEATKFNANASAKALETYGDGGLKYYDIILGKDGQPTISKMDVKISLTGQWLKLLNLDGLDKRTIGTIERLNEALLNDEWRALHEKKLSMIAYRIPTSGRNFIDVMLIKEFLPAAVGDAIIMPKEMVIKNGGDFDIDKMFVFYPNLTNKGNYMEGNYSEADLQNPDMYKEVKGAIQNKLYETMADVILHPSNYIELVTPSVNFHIMPILNKIFEKLGIKEEGKDRQPTDYKNTKILERLRNYEKFISLLKGKSDLGIAAVANTFNVLFQLANASANPAFLNKETIKTFFNSDFVEKSNGRIINIDFSSIFDEDGVLKSEFFSEFINAFVDVANDDYVFAANVVTELSPIMFYMKYSGIGSGKILNYMNQPAIREFTKNMSLYQNKFVKLNGIGTGAFDTPRRMAMDDVLTSLGYFNITAKNSNSPYTRASIEDFVSEKMIGLGKTNLDEYFTEEALLNSIKTDKEGIKNLTEEEKLVQLAMLLELENLREQSNSITDAQKFLNFDTNPFSSSFDVYVRNEAYKKAISNEKFDKGNNILSPETIKSIKKDSIITHLDMSRDIAFILSDLFPVSNDLVFNSFLLNITTKLKDSHVLQGQDDMLKFARTAKNDYMNYVLQNNIGKSKEGMKFFHETFETDKGFNEYMAELVQTSKLVDMWNTIKDMTYKEVNEKGVEVERSTFELLTSEDWFPFVKNIINTIGVNNPRLKAFSIIESSSNQIEKNSIITQFNELSKLNNPEDKPIKDFFKNLALYSIFQSGMNTSDVSYTSVAPVGIINKLYGYAIDERADEYSKLDNEGKLNAFNNFLQLFKSNNPLLFNKTSNPAATPTREKSSRGKWYAQDVKLNWQSLTEKEGLPKTKPVDTNIVVSANIPQNKVSGELSYGSTVTANDQAIKELGPAPHSIDMIIAGYRTRTTRSATEMDKYAVKVGDIVKHFGTSVDGTTKEVLARVTAIHEFNTPGWKGTWEKEGWRAEDVYVIDRFNSGAVAIEFELLEPAVKRIKIINGVKVISQADVDAYHAYLQKSNDKAPKEFFTSNTTFKEFYNPATSKREKAPQSSKWVLKDNGLYDLIDKDGGEVYIEDVDLRTGIKIVEPSTEPATIVSTGEANKNIKKLNSLKLFMINHKESKVLKVGDDVEVYFNKSDSNSVLTIKSIKKINDKFKVELNSGKKTYSYTVDRLGKGDTVEIEPDNNLLVFEKDLAAFNKASAEFQELKQVNQPFVQGKLPAPTISNLEKYSIARYVDQGVPEKVEDEGYKLTFDGHPNAIFYLKIHRYNNEPIGWVVENVNTGFRATNIEDTAEEAYKDFMTKLTGAVQNIDMSNEKNVKLINTAGFDIEKLKAPTQTSTSVEGFQGYKDGFENTGKGTPLGDGKDKAMREAADSFIGEIKNKDSSSQTSLKQIEKRVSPIVSHHPFAEKGNITLPEFATKSDTFYFNLRMDNGNPTATKVMLARNSEFKGKELNRDTKDAIRIANKGGAEFVVGDMPGVDSQFIDYLQEIGAKFTIYHTGTTSRIQVKQPTQSSTIVKKVYQGYDKLDNREFNYFTEEESEAKDYGANVREVKLDTTGFLKIDNKDEYYNEVNEFSKISGIRFDILDNSKIGLENQAAFFKFLKAKGYKGLDMLGGIDSKYAVSFEFTQPSTIVKTKKPFERTFIPPTRDAQGNVISKDKEQPMAPPEVMAEQELKEKINEWIEKELPWSISTPASQIAEMYKKEKLSSETLEEFLKRLSCGGKLI